MDTDAWLDKLLGVLATIYYAPIAAWNGSCSKGGEPTHSFFLGSHCEQGFYIEENKLFAVILGIIFYGGTILLLALLTSACIDYSRAKMVAYRTWRQWRRERKHCQHCGTWTTHNSVGPNFIASEVCDQTAACCRGCTFEHKIRAQELEVASRVAVNCPTCSGVMVWRVCGWIPQARCVGCGNVLIDYASVLGPQQHSDRSNA